MIIFSMGKPEMGLTHLAAKNRVGRAEREKSQGNSDKNNIIHGQGV